MHRRPQGGLHQDQGETKEGEASSGEEMVLPSEAGNSHHTVTWDGARLWQEFNILKSFPPPLPHKLNLRLNLSNLACIK